MHALQIYFIQIVSLSYTHYMHISWIEKHCIFPCILSSRHLLVTVVYDCCSYIAMTRFALWSVQYICFPNTRSKNKQQNPFATSPTKHIVWVKILPPNTGKYRIWSRIYENYFPRALTLKYSSRYILSFWDTKKLPRPLRNKSSKCFHVPNVCYLVGIVVYMFFSHCFIYMCPLLLLFFSLVNFWIVRE